jgi:4,5-DOPA dioxygenase extradiol
MAPVNPRLPAIFFGHGNPMNALGNNRYASAWAALGAGALLSVATPEHYLPLLYVLGAAHADDAIAFPVEGIDGGSVSMLSVQFG